ncbi:MAG TPA: VWA domain-containing protein [Polyangiaceae bacterium]|nr:VWA domain-containing protein [Polyangiaceae bacterium]
MRRWQRVGVAVFSLVVLGLLAATYPLLARGDELTHARWSEPWALLGLLVVPLVFYRLLFGEDRRTPRLRLGTLSPLLVGPAGPRVLLRDVPGIAKTLGLALCVGALARPLNTLRPVTTDEEGIDIVVALDLSGSMKSVLDNVPDDLRAYLPPARNGVRPTRLDVAKGVLRDFIARRKTDRIGVVVFGADAYIVSPPTLDYHLLDELVKRMDVDLIDSAGTAIGDALGVAVARLRRSTAKSKAIILLTDGANQGGRLAPEYAPKLANTVGAHIYTIQIGQGEEALIQQGVDMFGQPRYVRVPFPVNPKLLKALADQTGGHTYVASDAKSLQASFHDVLDKLEKTKLSASVAHFEDLYRYLLIPGVLLLALDALLRALVLRRFP